MRPNRQADPAPRGAYRGRAPHLTACAPPNENCAPPNEDCAPKKITGSGILERKSRSKLVFLWMKTFFFFLEITCFRAEKPLEFAISAGKSLAISVKTFLFFQRADTILYSKLAYDVTNATRQ